MQAKLTISIDKNIVEQAKAFAKKKGRSLSEIIENYLKAVVEKEKQTLEISPEIKKLQGSVKLPADFDYKKDLQQGLSKKYRL
jgi:metal-responsive CopG/Arc/MetJ family transcriptional regulator